MKPNKPLTYITVGKVGSTYGVHGWLKIRIYAGFAGNILKYSPWYLTQDNNSWTPREIERGRVHGNGVIAKFVGINSPNEAQLLTNSTIAIPRSELPQLKKDEYYWADLLGLTVINKNNEILGQVINLIATGSNDVLIIKGEKEHAIPYFPGEVIKRIDLEKKEIHVDWQPL